MIFNFIKDIATGKARAFYTAFTSMHHRLLDAAEKMNPPQDAVQHFFSTLLREYIAMNRSFTEVLFYGVNNSPTILSMNDLRSLNESSGNHLYSLFLISLIRLSLLGEQQIADDFVKLALGIMPPIARPSAERLSARLRDCNPQECADIVTSIVSDVFPQSMRDPDRRMMFSVYLNAMAADLHTKAAKLMEQGNRLMEQGNRSAHIPVPGENSADNIS